MSGEKMSPHLKSTMVEALGIKMFKDENGVYKATMPVDNRTCQIFGLLNGGASIALAENLAGFASFELCDSDMIPVGSCVSANHVAPGFFNSEVHAVATPVKIGKTIHIWNVDVFNEKEQLLSTIRMTNLIIKDTHKLREAITNASVDKD
ncbi:PaaI family thioesterase [Succinivibrio dextrinosolvens]|jgi:uncharacterized protein (TIGR00369 family)|uniref:PaaI family thioesterase n=1 Tax=Succinivibrio dextrinosolvens TaxID=83771 RepID=UPI00192357AD|nr:hotdog fold thioesterase [Succinivibrio dextrinosolvens]MBE6424361.1 hotdog fold thioesterase [Succinivibrio dextrinosolvens]MBQ3679601.1 hotdog fold thioesterase [Succinivibrio sp.]